MYTLKQITAKVNSVLCTNFNTILLNKYMNGNDCIGFHKDRETGWLGTQYRVCYTGIRCTECS
jgi:hypothetical protein